MDAFELVTPDAFERALNVVRAGAAGQNAGIFGPASLTWRITGETAIFLGAGRALLLQLAHPWIAASIAEHSRILADPFGRFHRTFNSVFTMVFGTLHQAESAARRLHRRHSKICGVLPAATGPFAAGSYYAANEVAALRWVHATLVESALLAHDLVCLPLNIEERAQYWAEARLFAGLFGLLPESLPPDWHSFRAYTDAMSNLLTVGDAGRAIAQQLLCGAAGRSRLPAWYRALSVEMLSPRLRAEFGFVHGDGEHLCAQRALVRIRRIYPFLPTQLRTVGPYQEALARLKGRPYPGLGIQILNRLWIGQNAIGA